MINIKKKKIAIILLALAAATIIAVNIVNAVRSYIEKKNEVRCQIQLDLDEDIGLLICDHDVNGEEGSGGISNADRTKIKKDDSSLWFTFEKQFYPDLADAEELEVTLRFTVITEYCDPNYENIYPEEYTVPMEEISFTAKWGEAYQIRITGDKEKGYQAILQ